jgi:hypothetical protein
VTAPERRGPRLRWRPRPGNLIDRRGAALVPPILVAAGLNVAAVAGLADIAGSHAISASLTRIVWPWLCAVPAALAMSALGYYFAYRSIYGAEGGYAVGRRQLTAVVAAGSAACSTPEESGRTGWFCRPAALPGARQWSASPR